VFVGLAPQQTDVAQQQEQEFLGPAPPVSHVPGGITSSLLAPLRGVPISAEVVATQEGAQTCLNTEGLVAHSCISASAHVAAPQEDVHAWLNTKETVEQKGDGARAPVHGPAAGCWLDSDGLVQQSGLAASAFAAAGAGEGILAGMPACGSSDSCSTVLAFPSRGAGQTMVGAIEVLEGVPITTPAYPATSACLPQVSAGLPKILEFDIMNNTTRRPEKTQDQ
jgi:hypothetical protein